MNRNSASITAHAHYKMKPINKSNSSNKVVAVFSRSQSTKTTRWVDFQLGWRYFVFAAVFRIKQNAATYEQRHLCLRLFIKTAIVRSADLSYYVC